MNHEFDPAALDALAGLLSTMRRLRSPGGCDWDRQQNHDSLKKYILEEAYELVHAIDHGDTDEICEELGDLLLQIVFQAQIFSEAGHFGMTEIASTIDNKLKRRHPHIFLTESSGQEPDWHGIKREERNRKGQSHHLSDRIPRTLPALTRAGKLVSCLARETGETVSPLQTFRKMTGYLAELNKPTTDTATAERQLGRLLYQIAAFAHSRGLDAEEALRITVEQRIKESDQEDSG